MSTQSKRSAVRSNAASEPVLPADRRACLCTILRTLARKSTAMCDARLDESGLTLPQYGLLSRLDRLRTASLSSLAEAAELDLTSASRSVRVLVDAGLINVSAGKDRRTKAYRLSRDGRVRLERAFPAWQASQKVLEDLIPARRRAELIALTKAIASNG